MKPEETTVIMRETNIERELSLDIVEIEIKIIALMGSYNA